MYRWASPTSLRHNLWRPESSIVFVGYAAAGTPARRIIDGAKTIRLFDEEIPVRAHIHTINGFSAHADKRELLDRYGRIGGVETTYMVHGDSGAMHYFARQLIGVRTEIPAPNQEYKI